MLGDEAAISPSAKRGFAVFTGKAGCSACHSGWRFTDDKFHDIGTTTTDLGRGREVKQESLNYAFKTPTLRSVALRAPYMHNGSAATLADVVKQVEHMVKVAGVRHVAVGSDFDGGIKPPEGFADPSGFPALAAALRARGMSYDDVLAIFSLNALRVLGWQPPPR